MNRRAFIGSTSLLALAAAVFGGVSLMNAPAAPKAVADGCCGDCTSGCACCTDGACVCDACGCSCCGDESCGGECTAGGCCESAAAPEAKGCCESEAAATAPKACCAG